MAYGYLFLGMGLLAALLLLARWFARAEPKTVITAAKWVGGALAVLLALYLVFIGRGGAALGLAALAYVLVRRARAGGFARHTRPSPGGSSGIETSYLRMSLDHESGEMDGDVLHGAFAGRTLSSLGLEELLALLAECARADEQSARLLETYLDRGPHDDWRERMAARMRAADAGAMGAMTPEQAREVLGVGRNATAAEIKDAHRHLMQSNHPDRGGSTYLAAEINRAKEVLLG